MFICNAIQTAPFRIKEVQTDNGYEFTNTFSGQKVPMPTRFEQFLIDQDISYRPARIGTPKHNGRVERQHGLDMQRFYKRLKLLNRLMLESVFLHTTLGVILEL